MLNLPQKALILFSGLLFCILYFGFDTKPKSQAQLEESRALNFETTDIRVILADAKQSLTSRENGLIGIHELELQQAIDDTLKAESYEKLAREWYQIGYPEISGFYAEEIAKLRNDAQSWGIAGTTYTLCIQKKTEERIRNFCQKRAVQSFENAISEDPDNIDHRLNMALLFVESPPASNPMKGIQMLLGLNSDNPDDVKVLNQLGRLAIQTKQWEKALERLSHALTIEPNNRSTICMIGKVYQSLQQFSEAAKFEKQCSELNELKK